MNYRIEHDSMGDVKVPQDKLWGAQTQRSLENFKIGDSSSQMPRQIIYALAIIKKASATVNSKRDPQKMTPDMCNAICVACDEIISGKLDQHFPLVVFQTGSGTQTNMNVNEVISNRANQILGQKIVHPNDHGNMSQSSNDVFPSAMHISAVLTIKSLLLKSLNRLIGTLEEKEIQHKGIVKSGRTHLQDATPISFSQEISGWRASLRRDYELIESSLLPLSELALGGTAVGTGLCAPEGFDVEVAKEISDITGHSFITSPNKFHSLTSKDELVFTHGALKALAADLMKIANDIRWLSSGPRCGLGEIHIPENEPGSSIMPGKVNPTQCEAVTMVAVQVMANDTAVSLSASQGNFELNVFMPVCISNFLQSVILLADSIESFNKNCVSGIYANKEKMQENLHNSLMLVTAISPHIGYENAAKVAKFAYEQNVSLKDACISLKFLDEQKFDEIFKPEQMI